MMKVVYKCASKKHLHIFERLITQRELRNLVIMRIGTDAVF
ncbi:hypothetical protein ACFX13_015495 [Malus domestica]